MRDRTRTVIGCAVAAVLLLALFNLFSMPTSRRSLPTIDYSSFIADVEGGKVDEVTFRGAGMFVTHKDRQVFQSYVPHVQVIPGLTDRLLAKGVTISARPSDEDVPSVLSVLASWLPTILFYVVLYFALARPLLAIARQMEGFVKAMQSSRPPISPT